MATYAQIANDLTAQAARFDRTHEPSVAKSFRRGATAIRELIAKCDELEAAAEAEAQRREDETI